VLIFSLNGLPRHLLNDLIICTEKSFFEGPARHLPARALQWQAGRSRSGEAGGSEGLSDPEPVEGERARGIQSTKFNSLPFEVFPDCVPGQHITSFIFRVLRMSLNPLPFYLMLFTYCKQFLPKIPV
jgi:hypothetical protein